MDIQPIPKSETLPTDCRNCTAPLESDDFFCRKCGQSVISKRVTMRALIQNAWVTVFSIDRGFFYTSVSMFRWPGHVIRDYLQGRTVCYVNPFNFMLLWTGISELIIVLNNKARPTLAAAEPPPVNAIDRYFDKVYSFIENYPSVLIILFLPVLAWIASLFFKRYTYNVAEHTIALAFIVGQVTLLETLLNLGYLAFPNIHIDNTIELVAFFLVFPMSALCYHQWLDTTWWRAALGAVMIWLLGFAAICVAYITISLTLYGILVAFGITF